MSRASDSDLLHIVPVAIIVIAILLALALRSLVAPMRHADQPVWRRGGSQLGGQMVDHKMPCIGSWTR